MTRAAPIILALTLLAACSRAPELDRLAAGESGRVAEVRSGDALALDSGLVVRLAGVEAPKGEQPYAAEARAALVRLVDGRSVQLLYGGARRDTYGRALAQVKLTSGGQWLQRALLRAGAVRERTWPDNRALAVQMQEDEAYARNRRPGPWKLDAYRALLPGETRAAEGFTLVEGRVRRIDLGARSPALDFADRPGNGFEAEIADQAAGDFKTAGKTPEQLRGRLVRIRGPIRYGPDGPLMRLDHPEQVELLKEKD